MCVEQLVGCSKGQALTVRGLCHFKHPASQYAHSSDLRPCFPAVLLPYVNAR